MRRPSKLLIGLALAAAGVLGAGSAFAWGHHSHVVLGFNFGPFWGPYWGPAYYYPAPLYYPAPVAVSPPAPAQYVERSDQPLSSGYWYYCDASRAYYPYVKECPGGWKAVPPSPAPTQ
ncbi:MAG TPA: hypothetical protein VFJ70_03400 [Burkholderiales bacterium]|nr:hypothetical protein [Burkholderiales bacterium]